MLWTFSVYPKPECSLRTVQPNGHSYGETVMFSAPVPTASGRGWVSFLLLPPNLHFFSGLPVVRSQLLAILTEVINWQSSHSSLVTKEYSTWIITFPSGTITGDFITPIDNLANLLSSQFLSLSCDVLFLYNTSTNLFHGYALEFDQNFKLFMLFTISAFTVVALLHFFDQIGSTNLSTSPAFGSRYLHQYISQCLFLYQTLWLIAIITFLHMPSTLVVSWIVSSKNSCPLRTLE